MYTSPERIRQLNDAQLVERLMQAMSRVRQADFAALQLLAEMDTRRLYASQGYASLFAFATECLGLSEGAAYRCIQKLEQFIAEWHPVPHWLMYMKIGQLKQSLAQMKT